MRLPIAMIIITYLLSIGIDTFIWWRIKEKATKPKWQKVWIGLSAAFLIFLTAIVCIPKRGDAEIIPLMWMLYGYTTVYASKLIFVIFSAIGLIPKLWKHRELPLGLLIGVPGAICIFLSMWWGAIWGRRQIQVTNVEYKSEAISKALNGLKIAQISDLHVGTWGEDTTFISKFVDKVNSLHPDLVVFTGDIVNRKTDEIEPFTNVLARLKAPLGIYSILGNHDYGDYFDWNSPILRDENNRQLEMIQKNMGWKLLKNENVTIYNNSDSLMLIGVENWGEPPFPTYGDMSKAYPRHAADKDMFKILLTHNPEHWRLHTSNETDIDLSLSGHTHAMQFILKVGRFSWSPSKYRYENWGGRYDKINAQGDTVTLYVNIGAGEVGMPFRIGADPEITLITLRSK